MRAILLVALTGCSFIGVTRMPHQLPVGRVDCTESYQQPVVDSLVAAGSALALFAANACDNDSCLETRGLLAVPAVLLALPYSISALYGYGEVSRCDSANAPDHLAARASQARTEQALRLTEAAIAAARSRDCATVRELDPEIADASPLVRDEIFAQLQDVAACLAAPLPAERSCFDATIDNRPAHACFSTADECQRAVHLLATSASACTAGRDDLPSE